MNRAAALSLLRLPLACALLLAGPARGLEVQVDVGLDGLVVDGAWTPIEVRCTLRPDEPRLEGRVVLARPREAVASVEVALTVEPGETGVARLAAPGGPGVTYTVSVLDAAGRRLAEATPEGATALLLPDERLVLFVGPVGLPALGQGAVDDRPRVARLAPARLPRDVHALSAARAVVLKAPASADADHVELARDPAAAAALERYVRGGGTLVLAAGDGAFWRDGPLDALAPARVDGRGQEPPGALEPLLGAPEGARAVGVVTCTPRPGARVTWAGERHPLVIERALGRGRVVLVTFDLDRDGARGAAATASFLDGLLARPPATPPLLRGADALALLGDLQEATPPLGTGWFYGLALAAAAQVVGVSLFTAVMVRRRGAWAGLFTPPLTSLGVAAALLVAGALARGGPRVTTLLLEVPDPGGGAAAVHAAVGLAAGRAASFSLEVPPPLRPDAQSASAFDLLRPRGARAALRLRPGRPALVTPLELGGHGRRALLLVGRAVDGDPGLDLGPRVAARALPILVSAPSARGVGERLQPAGGVWPQVEVTSREEVPLEGLRVLTFGPAGARLGALAPLSPGESVTFTAGLSDVVAGDPPPLPARDLEVAGPGAPAALDALLARVARRLEAAWLRAAAATPHPDAAPLPAAWVLHARLEPGSAVPVLDEAGRPLPDALTRTVRITCAPAEGGW